MNAQYKTKAEIKAEQASQPSQDNSSQDKNSAIPSIDGLESSLETLYTGHRLNARQITQGIKVQAYTDEFQDALAELKKGEVQPDFLQTLQKDYTPAQFAHVPSRLLIQYGADKPTDDEQLASINVLMERCHFLRELEILGSITDEDSKELNEILSKLLDMGVTV